MPRHWAEPQLKRMVETLRHGPNYETGTWIDESTGVYVGWAALKNSFASGMPLRGERGEVTLIFSGEDYAAPDVIQRVSQNGRIPANAAPAYLVDQYQTDAAFPANLNGRFQGLVADQSRGVATLFNDRYGLHRIYFHESSKRFTSPPKQKQFCRFAPSCAPSTHRASANS